MITFYVKSFSQKCTILANSACNAASSCLGSLEKMNAQLATYPHKPGAEAEQDMTALMGLSNFLEEHIEVQHDASHSTVGGPGSRRCTRAPCPLCRRRRGGRSRTW